MGAGGFYVHECGDELRNVVGRVIFGQGFQPTGDTIISALGQQPGHLIECGLHSSDIANLGAVCNWEGLRVTGLESCHGPSQPTTSSSEHGTRTMCPP